MKGDLGCFTRAITTTRIPGPRTLPGCPPRALPLVCPRGGGGLTWVVLSLSVGERPRRVVVVAMVVVVSMMVVAMSASRVVAVVSALSSTDGPSPTRRRWPSVRTLGSLSAASASTLSPL